MLYRYHSVTGKYPQVEVLRVTLLFCWRPRRDLNPCYRRERGRRSRNLLKLDGMDSALRPF